MSDVWTHDEEAEALNDDVIRQWQRGEETVTIEQGDDHFIVTAEGPSDEHFAFEGHEDIDDKLLRSHAICDAVEWCVDRFDLIPEHSVWMNNADHHLYTVENTTIPEDPEDETIDKVFCSTTRDDKDEVWIERDRFFTDQLEMVEPGVY